MAHTVVKPEKLADHAVGVLAGEVVVPNLMVKKGIEDYKGAKDDTLNFKVKGTLPFREYGWRNDRSTAIQFDEYAETKVSVTFGGNIYQGVAVTDEQAEMDFQSYTGLINPQAEAVGRGLESKAVSHLEAAPYEVVIPVTVGSEHGAFVEARRALNLLRAPAEQRIMLVGSSFEANLLNNDKFNRADSVGESAANTALRSATIRNWMGFTVITSQEIDPDSAYAFVQSANVCLTAAPSVPSSVPFGASASYGGFAMRWLRDYDTVHQQDRSVVNTWYGFQYTKDILVGPHATAGQKPLQTGEHFLRGVKLGVGATAKYPDPTVGSPTEVLAQITGLTDPSAA
ncbi:hypothetical protein CLV30_106133 [Haloactinopolyspora alba]|uniref:Major capsid protein n=1 Tax=Haloactinopolyspora alba TaxID=648780 RepID=A0A2P8E3S3_9ACTN|nr:phage capsid protein [Haloactinopolyspora alba]PSL04128.1 hypothetical protein CLV30_106133 [Haloactinopolyspora alba]